MHRRTSVCCMSVRPAVCLCLSVCPSIAHFAPVDRRTSLCCQSVRLSINLTSIFCPSGPAFPSICCLSVRLSVRRSIYLTSVDSVFCPRGPAYLCCVSVRPSVCPSIAYFAPVDWRTFVCCLSYRLGRGSNLGSRPPQVKIFLFSL